MNLEFVNLMPCHLSRVRIVLLRTAIVCAICVAAFFTTSSAKAERPIRIAIPKASVSILDRLVTVGDVATIHASNRRVESELAALDLDTLTESGSTVSVSQEQIRIRLKLAGFDGETVTLTGVDRVNVRHVEVKNVATELEAVLRDELASRYQIAASNLAVKLDSRSYSFKNRAIRPSTLQINQALPAELPLGQKSIAVQMTDHNRQKVEVRLNVRIAVFRDLVLARKPIRKGEVMTLDNVEQVRRPIDNRRARFASYEQVVGKLSGANVNQYDLIKAVDVRELSQKSEQAIKKNALVNVIVKRGPLEVVLKGARAIDGGSPGDQIALMNPNTRENIVARVIDSSTAEIRY